MKAFFHFIALTAFVLPCFSQSQKAPAYPLITHDPYFSIWSTTDQLNASPTKHWTGNDHSLTGFLKVDGEIFQFMGPEAPSYDQILPAGDEESYLAKYTETQPAADWMTEAFDDHNWQSGAAPFGNIDGVSKTQWRSRNIWMRRTFDLSSTELSAPLLKLQYDDDVNVYLNGELIYTEGCCAGKYLLLPMTDKMKSRLKKGRNVFAIHVVNTGGGALLDVGIVKKIRSFHRSNHQTCPAKTGTNQCYSNDL